MRNLSELGIIPYPGTIPENPASKQAIVDFEAKFHAKLPDAYRDMLQQFNGGVPKLKYFHTKSGRRWVVNDFFSLSTNRSATLERRPPCPATPK